LQKALVVENLQKSYGRLAALKGISFKVKAGEIFALIGPNGAGKTTALRIIATLLTPGGGDCYIYGLNLRREGGKIRRFISYLPEEAGAYKNLTGHGYLWFMAGFFTPDRKERKEFVATASQICGLKERLHDKIGSYSKGMTRRLLLARAVMTRPKLAILDEPTSGLDVINALEIRDQIRELTGSGRAVLLSSHNMLEIEYLSDRVAIIDKGIIHETGTPEELKEKYRARNLEEVFAEAVK